MDTTTTTTTWGRRVSSYEQDPRAMRRYNAALHRLASTGEVLMFVLLLGAAAGVGKVLLATNFENEILTDGTTNACLYDGETGQIRHVDNDR